MSELLELIGAKRLPEAMDLAQEILATGPRGTADSNHPSLREIPPLYRDRFSVRTGRRIVLVNAAEVTWIQANGDYATLHTKRGDFLLRETLASLSKQLDPRTFIRVHRSTIVNFDEVSELRSLTNRDAVLLMRDGTPLRVSRTYISNLDDRLSSGCPEK